MAAVRLAGIEAQGDLLEVHQSIPIKILHRVIEVVVVKHAGIGRIPRILQHIENAVLVIVIGARMRREAPAIDVGLQVRVAVAVEVATGVRRIGGVHAKALIRIPLLDPVGDAVGIIIRLIDHVEVAEGLVRVGLRQQGIGVVAEEFIRVA